MRGFLARITSFFIVELLRSQYMKANHRFAIRHIMRTVFDELQSSFTEDNKNTTLCFMIAETLATVPMSKDNPLVEKLDKIVN